MCNRTEAEILLVMETANGLLNKHYLKEYHLGITFKFNQEIFLANRAELDEMTIHAESIDANVPKSFTPEQATIVLDTISDFINNYLQSKEEVCYRPVIPYVNFIYVE